ncbi:MAG: rhomboid family intramembrane serine protease [Pyrinomonadaceae bacterium]|nr:rhomboid family intramembrane serine protease [Pyrinomonadaceae bacterium]
MANNLPNEKVQNSNAGRPSMCPSCGSIIGAGQQECAVCGATVASTTGARNRPPVDNETVRFARAVLDRPYKFTIILLVANIFIFLLMMQTSGSPFSVLAPMPYEVLIRFGAKSNYYIQARHEWWRFITPMFLHINLLHLMVNMYSLWVVGPYVEKLYGSAKFVVFWVVTGFAGVVASYLTVRPGMSIGSVARFIFKPIDVPAGGASGALFGLVGVLFVFGIKFRHELPEGFRRAFGAGLLPMILLNLFIGYMGRGFIDNAAHLGGLVSGGILALAVTYRRPGEKSGMAITWRVLQVAAIAVVAVSFLMTVKHFRDPLPPTVIRQAEEATDPNTQKFVSWAKGMNEAQEAFYQAFKDGDVTRVDSALTALESAPALDPKADDLRERMKAFLVRAKALDAGDKDRPAKKQQELQELTTDFVAWSKEYNQWLKTNAKNYGLVPVGETAAPK